MRSNSQTRQASTIHSAGCEIWDLPNDSGVPPNSILSDELVAYLVEVIPIYDSLSNATRQLGALLLLSMHRKNHGLDLDHKLYCDARNRLAKIKESLANVSPPETVNSHFRAIGNAASILVTALRHMEQYSAAGSTERRREMTSTLTRSLHKAHALLKQTADPNMGLSSVDYDNTCCSCAKYDHAHENTICGKI